MPRFFGKIGFVEISETVPGVWEEIVVEREYYGDINQNSRRLVTSENLNDDIAITNEVSIVADPYANENFHFMRYVEFMGTKWKVSNVSVQYPRLVLTLGGLYTSGTQT